MMKIYTISIHPGFMKEYFNFGVGTSSKKLGIDIEHINLRDFSVDNHASVDSPPYSEEDGMVLRPEPLSDAIKCIQGGEEKTSYVIYTAAYGTLWNNYHAKRLSQKIIEGSIDLENSYQKDRLIHECRCDKLVFICGRFSGVDQRFIDRYVDEIFSSGDFILSGGELPVLSMIDSILRFIPGVLGNSKSNISDSFERELEGKIEYPVYSRPQEFEGIKVPEVLLSGDHKKIKEWKKNMSLQMTQKFRPDLLKEDIIIDETKDKSSK